MPVIARTTFMPWNEIEMEQGEYDSLLKQGLIALDDPAPAEDDTEAADGEVATAEAETPPATDAVAPAKPQRAARVASPEASE